MEDLFDRLKNDSANRQPPQPFQQQPYAFTEIINVNWPQAVDSDEETSPESQLWAKTLHTYENHPGTTNIWWGQRVDSPNILKLIVDWRSSEDHTTFHASPEFAVLLKAWQSSPTPITTDTPLFFKLPADQRYRRVAFQPHDNVFPDAVDMILVSRFPSDWNPDAIDPQDKLTPHRPRKVVWDDDWANFRRRALGSEGGWISDKATEGWSVGEENSYISIFRFKDAQLAQQFLDSAKDDIEKLKRIAERGIVIEVVKMLYVKTKAA